MMKGRWKSFVRNESGATIVEFALLAPVLLLVLLGSITAFDLFSNSQNVEKATFTIGDMLSRQQSVNNTTLNDMLDLLRHMVDTADDGGLRISSVARENGSFVVRWSKSVGVNVPSTALSTSKLPNISNGDTVLVTESFVPHAAVFAGFGIDQLTFSGVAAHRPRFVASMPFQ